ncbi:MAG: hypothetical protein ACD_62C00058G0012 [uncultured bacterium]|nr:MAG: hypothetical protein ACD_62C00058G0012 [uncultured bacterium]
MGFDSHGMPKKWGNVGDFSKKVFGLFEQQGLFDNVVGTTPSIEFQTQYEGLLAIHFGTRHDLTSNCFLLDCRGAGQSCGAINDKERACFILPEHRRDQKAMRLYRRSQLPIVPLKSCLEQGRQGYLLNENFMKGGHCCGEC